VTAHALLQRQVLRCTLAACAGAVAFAAFAGATPAGRSNAAEQPFLAEKDSAMTKMMTGMTIKPTGDVDRDFVAMMVPHHQGAIDMAVTYLRYGHNQMLRRLAQEIIITQQQEIAAMRLAVGENLPASTPSPTQVSPATPEGPMSMLGNEGERP